MGCVSSKNIVSVTPAIDYSGAFRSNVGSVNSGRSHVGLGDMEKKSKNKKNDSVGLRGGRGSELGDSGSVISCNSESLSFRLGTLKKYAEGEQEDAGWPAWLSSVAGEAIQGWVPLRADAFEKLEKIGQGTYSSVFRARELETGKTVALKKVRFDNFEPESVRFMAREIMILRKFDHPNVIKLEGIITSRLSSSIYLVFEYMEHDIAGLLSCCPDIKFSESQIKCYMKQLLSGLEHCHSRGIMHRDIKGSNLLVSNEGILKVADFGLANFSNPGRRQPLTSRVVTLWYRPPELLLGSTDYGVAVDLWSVGCVFAELLIGKPIFQGRTEVEQLHKIFKLCGTPPDEYWKKSRLPHSTLFKPQQQYHSCLRETFKDLPASAVNLLETLLSVEPGKRGTAYSALSSEYFKAKPYACDPSSLPSYPPSKEIDAKYREEARRKRNNGRVRGPERRKPTRKPLSISKLAPDEELVTKCQNLQKSNSYSVPSIEANKISMPEAVHAPKASITKEDAFPVKNTSQGDIPYSGPLQVSTSSGFAWAKRRNDDTYKRSHSRTLSRGHIFGPLEISTLSSRNNSEENKDFNEDCAESRRHGTYERSKLSVHNQWGKFDRPDSFDASEGYHSQELSMALYNKEEMGTRKSYLSYQDQGEKVEFSGPLLSQMSKIDELLERHERHIRMTARKSWFQIGKKHHVY